MNRPILRAPGPEDLPDILDIWHCSFGDPPELVAEFLRAGDLLPGAVIAETEGHAGSVMFAFEHLRFAGMDAAYLYALCTHPDRRGLGLGGAVVRELCGRCFARGAEIVCLSPASGALADWYAALLGMGTLQRFRDVPTPVSPRALPCRALSPEAYLARRRGAFTLTPQLLRAQAVFLERGGFYEIDLGGAHALSCADAEGDTLRVIELKCLPEHRAAALGALAEALGCSRALLRTRADSGMSLQYLRRDGSPLTEILTDDFFFTMA